MGAQVCRSDGTYGECVCAPDDGGTWEQMQLALLRRAIIGTWTGFQENIWSSSPCPVTMVFGPSVYTGHSPGEACVVLYWGVNDDSPRKTYLLDDVKSGGEGMGNIIVFFGPETANIATLQNVVFSSDLNQLKFQVVYNSSPPLTFSLTRN